MEEQLNENRFLRFHLKKVNKLLKEKNTTDSMLYKQFVLQFVFLRLRESLKFPHEAESQ